MSALPNLMITCSHPPLELEAQMCAAALGISVNAPVDNAIYQLSFDASGVTLSPIDRKAHGPIQVDFTGGKMAHRRIFGGGKNQLIAKAVGIKNGKFPRVLDATAGLGQDAFVLAGLGCEVTLLERSPIVHALLADGLRRAAEEASSGDLALSSILYRMRVRQFDSIAYLEDQASEPCEVIFLDPMFPERQKTAAVNKNMQALHRLLDNDADEARLLEVALTKAIYRVVVKRPRLASSIAGHSPTYCLTGKATRFDIYVNRSLQGGNGT